MKKLILSAVLTIGLAAGVLAQGTVWFDNSNNSSMNPLATSGGLFWAAQWLAPGWFAPVLLNQDVNAALWGGPSPNSLSLLATLLLSNGSAQTDITWYGNGILSDPSGQSYIVPGTTAGGIGYFMVQAWTGNYNSYWAAAASGPPSPYNPAPLAWIGESTVFANPLGGGGLTATFLDNMPAVVLISVPEPATFALAGLGAAMLCIFRRK